MPNIEHIAIDQDTEFAVEEVLNYAKKNGYDGNFATSIDDESDWLPGGNVVRFLDTVLDIATDILSKTKSPREKWRLRSDMVKIQRLREAQESFFAENKQFMAFPTSPSGILSNHLLNGVDLLE